MEKENKKPICLVFVAIILSLGMVISSAIITGGIIKIKTLNTIYVKGSAKEQIRSDMAMWTGIFTARAQTLSDAYKILKENAEKVKKYLTDKKIPEENITFSSVTTIIKYEILSDGRQTNKIEGYQLDQSIEIKSNDVDMVSKIARESTELIEQGIEFQSSQPQYFYTKLADLKIEMLAKASEDAKKRAEKITQSTGGKIGKLKSADMGVFQITPLYSTDVSDYGINDTSSKEKEITAVIGCTFELK